VHPGNGDFLAVGNKAVIDELMILKQKAKRHWAREWQSTLVME